MDFKQLKSLVEVVECRSFTKAAERLYISQPTVSAHIRQLEEELQSRLVIRTTKSIEITPRGFSWGPRRFPPPTFCRRFCRPTEGSTRRFIL